MPPTPASSASSASRSAAAAALAARHTVLLRRSLARCDPRRWRLPAGADRLALGLLALALLLRLALVAVGWPETDSDEATTGIQALHILQRGEHPIFYYGVRYMGALEAYLAAIAFRVFGPSLFSLRLGTLLLALLALGAVYLLARRLYSLGLALLGLALLAIGPAEALLRELWSGGGYAETLCFGALVMLLGMWLAQTSAADDVHVSVRTIQRLLAFAGWGLAAGLGIWSDTLVLPFVLTSGLLLAVFCWREWRTAMPCLLLGLTLGAFPLPAYAISAPDHNPFAGALGMTQASDAWRTSVPTLLAGQVAGTLLVALPTITGGSSLCALPQEQMWPLAHADPHALLCTSIHGIWGVSYVALLAAALVSSVGALRRHRLARERAAFAAESTRLALLMSATLTLLLFMASPVAARTPHLASRYLIGLLIALPAVLAPLYRVASLRIASLVASRRMWAGRLALAAIAVAFLFELLSVLQAVPAAHAEGVRREALVAHLRQSGVTRVYSEYWTCGWLIFLSREQIVCAALNARLQPGFDRYLPYRAMLRAAPTPAYVFPLGSAQAAAFATRLQSAPPGGGYARDVFAGYVIYRPLASP